MRPTITERLDDFSLRRVPASALQSATDIALVRMGVTVSASDLLFGYTIGLYFGFGQAVLIAFGYSAIVSAVSIAMGLIGLRERTSFALSSRLSFGRDGSRLPSLVMAVIIAGFYGYVLGITVDVFPARSAGAEALSSVALGLVFLGISALGFSRGLKWVARLGVPLMILLVVVADALTVAHAGGFGALVAATPKLGGRLAVGAVLGLGVSKWLAGALITPDVTRFARGWRAVVGTTVAEFLIGNLGFNFLGLVLGLGLGASDLGRAFGLVGLTGFAVIAIVVQTVTVEMNELYAASLAVSNALGLKRWVTNAAVGLIGIAIAYEGVRQGIIASFLTFIGYVGYALPVIAGIILADYFIVRRMRYPEGLSGPAAVNWRSIAAFVVSLALNLYLGLALKDVLWHSLPLIPMAVYVLFSLPQTLHSWRAPAVAPADAG
jgi:cytosine permease